MRILRYLLLTVVLALVAPAAGLAHAGTAPSHPTLVAIRAAHHPGFDRIVFVFDGGLPEHRRVAYTDRIVGEGSGRPIPVAGRAILGVDFRWAHQKTPDRIAFRLPNAMSAVSSGEFEAVFKYGIGVAKKAPFTMFTLRDPARVVVDIKAGFPTAARKVFFLDTNRFVDNQEPFFVPRWRPMRLATPAKSLMDRLFAGPLRREKADGLRFVRSGAKSYRILSIDNGIARVQLVGGCNARGSTVTIAGEIMPTLRQLDSVRWVKIYGPFGHTADPTGPGDSIPDCLNP